jgi:menaquinol-cytochrome c reductase iron-sulfur subunit
VPDRHKQAKSKYTVDRGMPGAFDGETITRRNFMAGVTHASGGIAAAAFALPALGFALGPLFSREPFQWQPIGPPSNFSQSIYKTEVITIVEGIGEAGKSLAYVRQRDPAIDTEPEDQYNRWIALSSRCMHLGCPVRYVQAAERFICPCHGGVYNFRGQVAGGPPVRPLDRFYTRLNKDTGLVELGPRYSVNSELQRFSPRDPGQPLDGVGQFLYPKRFDTSILPPPNAIQ